MSKTTTIVRTRPDGSSVEICGDDSERETSVRSMRRMSEAEISAAATADPDANPMSPEQLSEARRIPRIKTMRRALGLTQEDFASRYHIPIGTLRDWEQGRTEPDQPARAYLRVIATDPESVRRPLEQHRKDSLKP